MPERLGSAYVLETRIGYGGMGEVWEGVGPDGPVAIKLLRTELAEDPDVVMRFVRERTILRTLASPHIVEVRDLVVEGDRLAIVMELVRGSDLRHRLRDEATMLPAQATDLVAQVLEGLAVAHAADVVHRDLKPENVLVVDGPGGPTAKVVDFGVARIAAASRTSHTTGLIGTPKYLAPELGSGGRATAASDVYSAGIVWYELLFGRVPFDGEIPLAVLRAHADESPVRPPKVPGSLWQQLEAMLAKDPAARPAAAEAATRLRALVPTLTGRVRYPLLPNRVEADGPTLAGAPGVPPGAEPPAATGTSPGRRRAPLLVIVSALGATALVAAAAGGVIAFSGAGTSDAVCDAGVRWKQASRPLPDGTRVKTATRSGTELHGIIQGGALLGIPDPEEARALGRSGSSRQCHCRARTTKRSTVDRATGC